MADLYKTIGQKTEKNLLADPNAEKIVVPLLPGQGELSAGTLIYRDSTGYWKPAATSQVSTSYELAVLGEDIDTGSDDAAVAEDAVAYRAGRFVYANVVYYNTSASRYDNVTDAMKLALRLEGIKFDKATLDGEFDNGTVKITYVANNGADPAEADVVIEAQAGTTYTILNNSDSKLGFTAPDTKSFSKWNTRANGSGTDYSAAGTYTANADLTLYAVWA